MKRQQALLERLARDAFAAGARLVALPEFFTTPLITGARASDAVLPAAANPALDLLRRLASEYGGDIGGSFLVADKGEVYNRYHFVTADGRVFTHDKDLPTMWENAFYTGGSDDSVLDTGAYRVGAAVCWELIREQTVARMQGRVDFAITGTHKGLLPSHAAPRCDPKPCQTRRRAPAAVILRSSSATPDGAILGRNPKGRRLFSRNTALQLAYVARLHCARCALSCEKIAAGAASHETATGPHMPDNWPLIRTALAPLSRRNQELSNRAPAEFARRLGVPVIQASHSGSLRGDFHLWAGRDLSLPYATRFVGATQIVAADGQILARRDTSEGAGWVAAEIEIDSARPEATDTPNRYWIPRLPLLHRRYWQHQNWVGRSLYRRRGRAHGLRAAQGHEHNP